MKYSFVKRVCERGERVDISAGSRPLDMGGGLVGFGGWGRSSRPKNKAGALEKKNILVPLGLFLFLK